MQQSIGKAFDSGELDAFSSLKMFEEVYNMLDRGIQLDEGRAFVFAVDSDVKQLIIDLNTKDQLGEKGIDALDDTLGEYAPFTVQVRSELGLQTDHIDFKVTGDYWSSWTVSVNGQAIEINVDPNRFNELVNDLGFDPEHVGLTAENINLLTARMLINYQTYVRKRLRI